MNLERFLVGKRRNSNPQECGAEETRSVFQRSTQGAKRRGESGRRQPHADIPLGAPFKLRSPLPSRWRAFCYPCAVIRTRQGAELRKRASVFQRSSQGAQAPQRSVRAARGRDSLPRHLELTRTSAKGSFSFIEGSAEIASRNLASEWDALSGAYFRRACTSRARPLRHSSRFCATLQTVRSSVRMRGYTQNDTFPMQYDAGSACTIRRGQ